MLFESCIAWKQSANGFSSEDRDGLIPGFCDQEVVGARPVRLMRRMGLGACLLLLLPYVASATTYYVAANGNDTNPGTEQLPWRTIQKGADTLAAGDRLYAREGTYREVVTIRRSGKPGKWIELMAYPGHTVILDGTGLAVPEWSGLVNILGSRYVRLEGFRVMNSEWAGIFVSRDDVTGTRSSHIVIRNNYVYNTASSAVLMASGSNYVVDGNETVKACNSTAWVQEIISIQYHVKGFIVRNNYVHHGGDPVGGGEGIIAKFGASNGLIHDNHVFDVKATGIYVDAWSAHQHDIKVFHNVVHGIRGRGFGASAEAGGTLERVHFYDNLVYETTWRGAEMDPGMGLIRNISFVNNVVYKCPEHGMAIDTPNASRATIRNVIVMNNDFVGNGGAGVAVGGDSIGLIDGVTVRNNIVSRNGIAQIRVVDRASSANVVVDHNLIEGFRGYDGEILGDDAVRGDPRFVNRASADFHLRRSSPAIDKGSSNGAPSVDFEGHSRPCGSEHDIGADEYCGDAHIRRVSPRRGGTVMGGRGKRGDE